MMLAGISWGGYSLRGRKSHHPVHDTYGNFLRTIPFVLLLGLILFSSLRFSCKGMLLAIISGGASALGYIIWYAALQDLNAKHATLIQLSVPLLAATGGVFFLSEPLVLRLIVAAVLILGGIALAIAISGRSKGLPSGPKKPLIEPVVR
jgi:drug/metabolite transporter (DMT)-like permease